jgi:hypothetical protein
MKYSKEADWSMRDWLWHEEPHPDPLPLGEGAEQDDCKEKAREHWEFAKDMINKMGYHRRDKEVDEIEKQL